MKRVLIIAFLAICGAAYGQNFMLKGDILDEKAQPLASATVVLLNPADSTLLYFSVSGNNGAFEMRNIRKGNYLLQVSLLGFNTLYRTINLPLQAGDDAGSIIMVPKVFNIDEVTVSADRIPMRIKKDTIEFDARAFKVKPDGVAEDLIKKLPGLEVDRAGNIKAMGEDVGNVLVDGKEFFGSDPKVATRNLPAEAIDKVQLFDRQTDESKFTGIDDGIRDPTLNLILDKDKKNGVFGDVQGGAGTDKRVAASGKVYRFTEKTQFAAIGMYNNVNQFGFSLGDYINFSGGPASFSSGDGHVTIGGESNFPVNFGQPVYGFGSNGAAGLNFSVSNPDNDRFFMSYLGNGSRRNLFETSATRNYVPDGSFLIDEERDEVKRDTAQRLTLGLRKRIGEKQSVILNGGLSYNKSSNPFRSISSSFGNDVRINNQERNSGEITSRLSGNADASYLLKFNEGKTVFKLSGRAVYSGSNSDTRFLNRTEYLNPYKLEITNQFFDLMSETGTYTGSVSLTRKITKISYIDLSLGAGYSTDELNREQGDIETGMIPDDDLSPAIMKTDRYLRPGLTWKLSTAKLQLTLALQSNIGEFNTTLNNDGGRPKPYFYLNPRASWEYDYRSGRRVMVDYTTSVSTPRAFQLLPVVNNLNPLSLFYGNRDLTPEYIHNGRITWWLFDQFSFTTLLTGLNIRYTRDRIGYARTVNQNLSQVISLVNVENDWDAGGFIDFSTPIKPLGIKVNLAVNEIYNRGISFINGTENINSNLTTRLSLTFENRKKDKWDIETGGALTITGSRYSVQESLNNVYQDVSWFSDVRYTPDVHFNFMASADITSYSARSFGRSQLIPLIGAEASYYFLKNQRGVLTLAGVDLLNRNTGLVRESELNYLVERRSDILGRYVMLSFKYRLNKVGDGKGGIDIQVKKR
jgi:Outer membrane protein beta-barrel family/Carboxypeptidase regulatory-like domain